MARAWPRLSEILGAPRDWAMRLTLGAAAGLFFGVIGPFGSYAAPLPVRLAFWTAGFLLGVVAYSLAVRFAVRSAPAADLPEWFAVSLALALVSAPYALVLGALFNGFAWPRFSVANAVTLYGQTLLLAAPLTVLNLLLRGSRAKGDAQPGCTPPLREIPAEVAPVPSAPPARALAGDVTALQMEDHYVRVHRPGRSELALMPMAQAVEALASTSDAPQGLRVHRSWWVARSAVVGHVFDGRNLRLRLKGGLEAPVARAQVAEVRALGWLDG